MTNYLLNIGHSTGTTASTASSIFLTDTSNVVVMGTNHSVETGPKNVIQIQHKRGVAPGVYFRFVKSKMSEIQLEDLRQRVAPLRHLLDGAQQCGQEGLVEELERKLVTVFRYQEAAAAGFNRVIAKRYIDDFKSKVIDHTVDFVKLSKFPRPIPHKNQKIIKEAGSLMIFDELWILFNNVKREKHLSTTKEKIKEKDPIVFGRFLSDPDNYIYITDWIDEYCDITLDKIVDVVGKDASLEITPLTPDDVKTLKDTVLQRVKAVNETNSSNWRQKEKEQEELEELRKRAASSIPDFYAQPLWKRILLALGVKR